MARQYTVGKSFNKGKIAKCECTKNDKLKSIEIKDECFCLIFIEEGILKFKIKDKSYIATGPCFVCFNEEENPEILLFKKIKCHTVYFHPEFLNVNMTFDFLRSGKYSDVAATHDMFLMRPFLENRYVVRITEDFIDKIITSFNGLTDELTQQRDWYWSCRSRSYFIELIIALERLYMIESFDFESTGRTAFYDSYLENAVLYIEAHYMENITLTTLVEVAKINHTTLTRLFKTYTSMTPMEYVTYHRILVAKKMLAFTEIPIKDVAIRCGYKTVQHFSKVFKEVNNMTPLLFRQIKIEKRKKELRR